MELGTNSDKGVVGNSENPFAQSDWINQNLSFTSHRREQVQALLFKTIEEIKKLDPNTGSYSAFVAIRWGYAEVKDNRLVPTANWTEWQPPSRATSATKSIDLKAEISTIRRSVSNSKRYDVLRRDQFQCVLCGASGREANLEIDHIVPISQGGTDDLNNLRCLCFRCNRGKAAKSE